MLKGTLKAKYALDSTTYTCIPHRRDSVPEFCTATHFPAAINVLK